MDTKRAAAWAIVAASLCGVTRAAEPATLPATRPAVFVEHAVDGGLTLSAPLSWRVNKPPAPQCRLSLLAGAKGQNMNLVVVPALPGETAASMTRDVPPGLAKVFAEFDLVSAGIVTLNGEPAARVVYRARTNGVLLQFCQFFVNKHGRDYVLTYTAAPALYAESLPTAERVAATLRVP